MFKKAFAHKDALRQLAQRKSVRTSAASGLNRSVIHAATHSVEAAYIMLGGSPRGLTADIVDVARDLHGENVIETARVDSAAKRLVKAFVGPFTLILVALAALSVATDVLFAAPGSEDPSTAILIGIMVLVSGILSFVQESRGAAAADALKSMVTTTCCVVRRRATGASEEQEIPMPQVVPGDTVRLAAGDMIPADVRIVEAKDLFVNQAALTGESEPVEKGVAAVAVEDATAAGLLTLSDCTNIAFAGTSVQSGSATGIVVATGGNTYLGCVASALSEGSATLSAFDAGVASVSRVLIVFMLVMCPIVFVLCGATKGSWLDALLFAVSIAVGITPQMLPVIVTTCLSRGAAALRREHVIVKELGAIQNMGAMDVLCCDKTGTLTQDRVVLERHLDVLGRDDESVLRCAYLNSYFQTGLRNLIDQAIIGKLGELEDASAVNAAYEKVDEIPFDFERRRMSVVVREVSGETLMVTKGAVEEVLGCCSHAELDGEVVELTADVEQMIFARTRELNDAGLRVVAVAQKRNPRGTGAFGVADECGMVLVGYLAFLDPPKPSAAAAIEQLVAGGVAVKVLTGDSERVAAAVCAKVGIDPANPLLGSEVDALTDEQLARRANETALLAKLSPLQKARVVRVLRECAGRTVGFMGDGINDAAAMRAADVGISVDTAVDVAKESADIILTKKDLLVLARGIVEGRRTHTNTLKYVKLTTSSNFGNVLSVLVASALLPFLPMSALQLLFLGLVSDLSFTALPWDRVDESSLRTPRRWDTRSVVAFMLSFGPVSTLIDVLTFATLWFVVCPLVAGGACGELSTAGQLVFAAAFQTGWFVESMWTQTAVVHMLRAENVRQTLPVRGLAVSTLVAVALISLLPFVPVVGEALGLVVLPPLFFGLLVGLTAFYLLLAFAVKCLFIVRHGELL